MSRYNPPFTITPKMLDLVSKISEYVAKLEILETKPISLKLRKVNRIKTIVGTLEIEGSKVGIEKVTAIMEGKMVLASPKEIAEVKGAIRVYDELENFDYKNIKDILKAHKILMKDLLSQPGKFRTKDVGVGDSKSIVHIAPPASKVPYLMNKLFKWLENSNIHPLIKSSVFHYEFEFIHPFIDGNGRIGRLWQTLILYKWKKIFINLPIESLIYSNQEKYYKALEDSGSMGESTPFIEFMLEAIMLTCKETLKEIENVPKNVPKNVPLKREEKIIDLIKENKNITIDELASKCGVSSKTIKRDIAKLKKDGKIKRVGSSKAGYWELC